MYSWKKHKMESWKIYFFRLLFKEQYWALRWYADEHNYNARHATENMPLIMVDNGTMARMTLK